MARYKHTDIEEGQGLFLTVNLKEQIVPGTFEYMLNDLVENEIDIKMFDENYKNDETGSKAIPPAILIKLIVYGYSKGVKSSRKLMELGKRNMIAKALTEDMEPHWTTIADFVSRNEEKFQKIFAPRIPARRTLSKPCRVCPETGKERLSKWTDLST